MGYAVSYSGRSSVVGHEVQTRVVHLIRASMRFVSYTDRRPVAGLPEPIYTATTLTDADTAMVAFAESDIGRKCPSAVKTWIDAWERFIPFLEFPPEVRRVIYTTNSIVILSRLEGVLDVRDGAWGCGDLPVGRGYLQTSSTRILWRSDVRSAGSGGRVAA